MSAATLLPGLPEDYYAPEFVVEVEGRALDPAQKGDVLEIKVVLSVDELASVDLKLNNYDDSTFDLKWSDSVLPSQLHFQVSTTICRFSANSISSVLTALVVQCLAHANLQTGPAMFTSVPNTA